MRVVGAHRAEPNVTKTSRYPPSLLLYNFVLPGYGRRVSTPNRNVPSGSPIEMSPCSSKESRVRGCGNVGIAQRFPSVPVQPEMESHGSRLDTRSALRAGFFRGSGVYRSDGIRSRVSGSPGLFSGQDAHASARQESRSFAAASAPGMQSVVAREPCPNAFDCPKAAAPFSKNSFCQR